MKKLSMILLIILFPEICSSSTLMETARRLAAFHKPLKVDFRARFGLPMLMQKDKVKG